MLDRLYPSAVAGDTLAFAYEDMARSGSGGAGQQQAWLTVPSSMPNVAALVKDRQYGVLVWRGSATGAATELQLPWSFAPAATTVVSDLGTVTGLPCTGTIRADQEIGSSTAHRLLITPADPTAATLHYALIVNTGNGTPTAAQLSAAATELASWQTRAFGG